MNLIKKILRTTVAMVIFSLSMVSLSSVKSYAATCVPDVADPLKCFCEEVSRDVDNQSTESKKICDINETERSTAAEGGLLAPNGIVKKILGLLSWITGLLAGVYLIVGGFKIITSSGESDSVASGRRMIIYALVGIVVVISSNLIINFVIGLVNNASK